MIKDIQKINLLAQPPAVEQTFDILREAGSRLGNTAFGAFALFGGAVRDPDYSVYHGRPDWRVNDHDLRVWLPPDNYTKNEQDFARCIEEIVRIPFDKHLIPGTDYIRYYLTLPDVQMDVSIRPAPKLFENADVAKSRAKNADIGLSAIAVDSSLKAWAAPEYVQDRNNHTLSIYPHKKRHQGRVDSYRAKMEKKFNHHKVVYL